VMRNDEIAFFFKCLLYNFFRTIQTNQYTAAFDRDIAGYQSTIIIIFLESGWGNGLQMMNDIADLHVVFLINRLFEVYQFAVLINSFQDYPDMMCDITVIESVTEFLFFAAALNIWIPE